MRQCHFILKLVLFHLRDVVFEQGITVRLLHCMRVYIGRGGFFLARKPFAQIHRFARRIRRFHAAQHGQLHRAVLFLRAPGLDEVDRRITDKVRNKQIARLAVHRQRLVILLEHAVFHQADARRQRHGLHLVVRDVDKRRAGLQMQALKLGTHFQSEFRVEVGKRLIHEEHLRVWRKRAGDGHALLLAAGKLAGITIHEHADFDDAGDAADNQVDFLRRHLAHAAHRLAALHQGVIVAQGAAVLFGLRLGGGQLLLQLFDLLRGGGLRVARLLQLHAHQRLGRKQADFVEIDQAEIRLIQIQLFLLIDALVDGADDVLRFLQNLNHACRRARVKVDFVHLLLDVGQAEGDILVDGHVRPERVVLEQETDLALVGGNVDALLRVKDRHTVDGDAAACRRFKARDHAQGGRLAAAGRAKQRDKRIIFNDHAEVIHRVKLAPALGDIGQFNPRHLLSSNSFVQTCAGQLVNQRVADQDEHDQNQVDAAGKRIQTHLVEIIQHRGDDFRL